MKYDKALSVETFSLNDIFLDELNKNYDGLSDCLSKKLSEHAKLHDYEIICDIVKSKIPQTINLDQYDEESGEPVELKSQSPIIAAIKEQNRIKVYVKNGLSKHIDESFISRALEDIVSNW
jgi:hypothetical protein